MGNLHIFTFLYVPTLGNVDNKSKRCTKKNHTKMLSLQETSQLWAIQPQISYTLVFQKVETHMRPTDKRSLEASAEDLGISVCQSLAQ